MSKKVLLGISVCDKKFTTPGKYLLKFLRLLIEPRLGGGLTRGLYRPPCH